jgi:hypothetical protein
VGRKLDLLLTSQTPDTLSTYASQIAELRERAAENREQLLEQVAYSWFNRLAALRYLDAKGWHPFGCRVLMPAGEGETQPELLKLMRSGSLPLELNEHTNESRLNGLLDGRLPTAQAGADPQGEVYRELILAVCRSYHQLLPTLFEGLDDASELLLPDVLLSDSSIAGGFRSQISDSDCEDVEIIGWLYQFYISEKKDQVIGKVVKSEDIPAATQLFTPNWIVKYMVQNSLGAQWLATYPNSALKGQMEYYIEPAEQTEEVKAQLAAITPESLNPEELTLIDPACGSGHILVEAYELFKAIYLERGYQQREIPQLILEKNLFGLDIDERASQLTSFALMMKGRGDDRRLFERGIQLNVMALVNSDGLDVEALTNAVNLADHGLKMADLVELKQLFEHATTFGSLIQVPKGLAEKLAALRRLSELKGQDMLVAEALKTLEPLVKQAELLAARYDAVVANPPYMGIRGGMNSLLKFFTKENFPDTKSDLFACFIERGFNMAVKGGYNTMVTMQSWMFLTSYQRMREQILANKTVQSLVHMANGVMGIAFGTASTTLRNISLPAYIGAYSYTSMDDLDSERTPSVFPSRNERLKTLAQIEFNKIPGSPIAYWISEHIRASFENGSRLDSYVETAVGLFTCDNERFLRNWQEVSIHSVGFGIKDRENARESGYRFFPIQKGGGFRKWFGLNYLLVQFDQDGLDIRKHREASGQSYSLPGESYYFRNGITWSGLTSSLNSFRQVGEGHIFESNKGQMLFSDSEETILGFLNSCVARVFVQLINPTLSIQSSEIRKLPLISPGATSTKDNIFNLLELAKKDDQSFETSWNFQFLELSKVSTDPNTTLEASYNILITQNKHNIAEMKRLEEENNRLFIDAYGLQDELTPGVPIEQITLTVNPAYRYGGNLSEDELWNRFRQDTMKEFLSYATGCMMGRYSLDHPGLILANAGDTLENYYAKVGKSTGDLTFQPDRDGIIPVLDSEWSVTARKDGTSWLPIRLPEPMVHGDLIPVPLLVH